MPAHILHAYTPHAMMHRPPSPGTCSYSRRLHSWSSTSTHIPRARPAYESPRCAISSRLCDAQYCHRLCW
eukprot:1511908-Rhodomonas_salina.1